MKIKYYSELDGVRGLASLMVVIFHFFQVQPLNGNSILNTLQKLTVLGQTGVTLFFVLSGFLITRILLSSKDSNRYFSTFYIRRALRIFPLYYLFLAIFFFFIPFIFNFQFVPYHEQWYYWIYLQNFALTFNWPRAEWSPVHYWSLAVEEHFYFIWPFIVYYFPKKRILSASFFLIIVAFVTRILLFVTNHSSFYFTLSTMDGILFGAILALQEKNIGLKLFSPKAYANIAIISVSTCVTLGIISNQGDFLFTVFKFILFAIAYYGLIGFVITSTEHNFIKRVLYTGIFQYSGKVSYGLYVFHPLIFRLYFPRFQQHSLIDFIASVGLSYVIAHISYKYFEVKVLSLKRYFEYGK